MGRQGLLVNYRKGVRVEEGKTPTVEDLTEAVASAMSAMPPEARAQTDQGIAHVRDLAQKVCNSVEYGDESWKEVWMAATITLHTLLTALHQEVPNIPRQLMDGISMEFMLLGAGDPTVNLEEILNVESEEE